MINPKSIVVLFCLLALIGCATTKGDWERARQLDTAGAYQEFLKKYPQSAFSVEAKNKIYHLDWKRTRSIGNIRAYQEFIEKYPQSELSLKAKVIVEENCIRFNRLKSYENAVDILTLTQFKNDGWNPKDPEDGELGFVGLYREKGRISYVIGYYGIAKDAGLSILAWSFAENPSSHNQNVRFPPRDDAIEVCRLLFEDRVLKLITFKKDVGGFGRDCN